MSNPWVERAKTASSAVASCVRAISRRVAGWPVWARVAAAVTLLVSVIGFVSSIIQIQQAAEAPRQKQQKFAAIYNERQSALGNDTGSSRNFLISVIPDAIADEHPDWPRISYSWKKHADRINGFYRDLALCLEDGTCVVGDGTQQACRIAAAELRAHIRILALVQHAEGINVQLSGGSSPFGDAFGPSVSVPNVRNLKIVADACGKKWPITPSSRE